VSDHEFLSGNDGGGEHGMPACFQMTCPGYFGNSYFDSVANPQVAVCEHILDMGCDNLDTWDSSSTCTFYEHSEVEDKIQDCTSLQKYPNLCCEMEINCQKKACKEDEAQRAGAVVGGLILIALGLIFTVSFSCGICPICCFAKETAVAPAQAIIVAQAAPAQAPVMVAQAAPAQAPVMVAQAYFPSEPAVAIAQAAPVAGPKF